MQHGRPVAVQHALGLAGGARGIAERRCGALVQIRPVIAGGLAGHQLFIAEEIVETGRGFGHMGPVGHHHHMAQMRQLPLQARHQRHEGRVDEQNLVLGMVEDIGHLVGGEPGIDGVAHGPHPRDREIEFEMAVIVPGQGRDPVAWRHFQADQTIGQRLHPVIGRAIAVTVDRAFAVARHDLGRRMTAGGILQKSDDGQWCIHHLPHQRQKTRHGLDIPPWVAACGHRFAMRRAPIVSCAGS